MSRIRWVEDYNEDGSITWLGYLGSVIAAGIETSHTHPEMTFFFIGGTRYYTKLSSAKRGAERMIDRFLRDAGLEVKEKS